MEVTITTAGLEDLPTLAEINQAAYAPETITQIAFKNWPNHDPKHERLVFTGRVYDRLIRSDTQVFKATNGATGEMVGFVCLTLDSGETGAEEMDPISSAVQQEKMKEAMNMEFVLTSGALVDELNYLAKGTRHYRVSTFAVTPKYQGKGIGSKLLRYCLDIADKEVVDTWLTAMPGSHDLYLRNGFEDVEVRDVDLNRWDRSRFRGYGIYRSYGMVRKLKATQ